MRCGVLYGVGDGLSDVWDCAKLQLVLLKHMYKGT